MSRKTGLAALAALVVMAGNVLAAGTGSVDRVSNWYPAGTNLTVTAIPAAGDALKDWTGSTNSTESVLTFVVDGPKSFTATFVDIMHTITASVVGNGTITPVGEVNVAEGDNQSFTIAPAANHHIAGLKVDDVSVAVVSPYTFNNVTDSHTIEATFAIDTYTVTFDLGDYGTRTGGGELSQEIAHGTSATAPEFTVAASHNFTGWDKTFNSVTADMTVAAQYELKNYTLIYIAGANGSISGTTPQTVAHGSSGTQVTAVPAEGYHFVQWDDDVMTVSRTDANVTGDLTVTASFAQNQYSFVVYSQRGTSNPAAGTTNWHAHGATVPFAMTDSPVIILDDSKFDATGWIGTGSVVDGTGTNGSFTIEANSTMTWQWSTNYWIQLNTTGE